MKKLLYFLLGYTTIKVKEGSIKRILNFANLKRISIISITIKSDDAFVKVYTKDEAAIFGIVEHTVVNRGGIPHIFDKYKHRLGIIIGLVLFFFIIFLSPKFIWEVNVSGTEKLSVEYIQNIVKNEGVYIGAFYPTIDRKNVYMNVVKKCKDISWLSVNFIGSTAHVEVIERDYSEASKQYADGANLISKKSGQIIDVDVISGKALIKKGDVVNKGDLLVSGVFDTEKMGTRYVYSDGAVWACVHDVFFIEIPMNFNKKTYTEEKVLSQSIKMFGKSVNIFKNYSISEEKYDTIVKDNIILNINKLPLSFETEVALPYFFKSEVLTEQSALKLAKDEFYWLCQSGYREILGMSEEYYIADGKFIYKCEVDAIENIAVISEFNINR